MRNVYSITWLWLAVLAASAISTFEFHTVPPPAACNVTVSAGADQTVCQSGAVVNLVATVTGTYLSAAWTPSTGIADTSILGTNARVDTTTTYTMTVRSINTQNLITNGDFNGGNVGFTSDYTYTNSDLRPEGRYAVLRRPRDIQNSFTNCNDHSGNGFMMVVNASGTPNNVWCQTITVAPNTEYLFSAWAASMVSQNPAKLQFSINGNLIGNVFTASSQTCNWREFTTNWTSQTASTAQICVANVNNTAAGNDFAIDDLSFRQLCVTTDEVTITVANVNAAWTGRDNYCKNEPTIRLDSLLDSTATRGGVWIVDGDTINTFNPAQLDTGTYLVRYAVSVAGCTASDEQYITVNAPANSGIALAPVQVCVGTDTIISLADLLQGEDAGGTWTEAPAPTSSGGAFNANLGSFRTVNQQPGTYVFRYNIDAPGSCPDTRTTVNVTIPVPPLADAGEDLELNCLLDMVTIGGAAETGSNIRYNWTAANGSPIAINNIALTEVTQPDTYTLVVTNTTTGCSADDAVTVMADITKPSATLQLKQLTCNQTRDGGIRVTATGEAPFTYALNDGTFGAKNEFQSLLPGNYTITVRDQNGCDTTLQAELLQPENLDIDLQADALGETPTVPRGDSVQLTILSSKPTDQLTNIVWSPDSIGCATCTTTFVKPEFSSTYSVRVTDANGCMATAQLQVFVQQIERIFVPTAFSPNGDGVNDMFYINAGQEVQQIKRFFILNRWGTMVYSRSNFQANDPNFGWDGIFNGTRVQIGVYVYVAEVEMAGGELVVVKGDVTVVN